MERFEYSAIFITLCYHFRSLIIKRSLLFAVSLKCPSVSFRVLSICSTFFHVIASLCFVNSSMGRTKLILFFFCSHSDPRLDMLIPQQTIARRRYHEIKSMHCGCDEVRMCRTTDVQQFVKEEERMKDFRFHIFKSQRGEFNLFWFYIQ